MRLGNTTGTALKTSEPKPKNLKGIFGKISSGKRFSSIFSYCDEADRTLQNARWKHRPQLHSTDFPLL
ncbi:hypothetical protein D3H55_00165 [Bacillus salacetis]|uniref:Uncharacterized protein n=1 Tax=Bacillus salacetis TaxID=2315464 RepID=A0A3A1R7G2_9BACI|nr:hypothetical protein D3H55_00165 [Bacillus salacetis]